VAEALGVRVIRMDTNQGRGAARALAMETARNEFVLCGDSTNQLAPNFLETALAWLAQERVVAVYGRCYDRHARTLTERWRARHLYKQDVPQRVLLRGHFSTFGAVVRKSTVLRLGNYNRALRSGEDYDLGLRLLEAGDVVADPSMEVQPVIRNTFFQVMERFSRWNNAGTDIYDLNEFINSQVSAWRILIPRDLQQGDLLAAAMSATVPYFSYFYADKRAFTLSQKSSGNPAQALQPNADRAPFSEEEPPTN
jgi:hypothetical protein